MKRESENRPAPNIGERMERALKSQSYADAAVEVAFDLANALRALVEADEAFADGDPDGICPELGAARTVLDRFDAATRP